MRTFAVSLVLLVLACAVRAEDAAKPVSVFDGKTFAGWKIITCEAEIQDGCIFLKAGNGLVQTERMYKDFIMEVDWKALRAEKSDSGFYVRYTDIPKGRHWPNMYQFNLRWDDVGNIKELPAARSTGLAKPGEWNHFKMTVIGAHAELEINGKPAWKADGITVPEGYIGIQAEVPGGGQFLFKNITIADLSAGK